MSRGVVVLVVALAVAGCSASSKGTVVGHLTSGGGPVPAQATMHGIPGAIDVRRVGAPDVVTPLTTDKNGEFRVILAPGVYQLRAFPKTVPGLGVQDSRAFSVRSGKTTTVNLVWPLG